MQIPIITKFLKRRGRSRLRRIMRGYRVLKLAKTLNLTGNIDQAFTNHHLQIKKEHFSKSFFGAGLEHAELICRQYLLLRCAGLNMNQSLLHAVGEKNAPVAHYVPAEWRDIIQKQGLNVSTFRTSILWHAFICMMLMYGFWIIAKIILESICALFRDAPRSFGKYVYFNALSAGNLPQPGSDGRSHDLVSWYMQWNDRQRDIDTLCHGVKNVERTAVDGTPVIAVSSVIPPLTRFGPLARFVVWALGASLLAAFDLLRGRWWHALLLNQAALAAQTRFQDTQRLARDYLFHNSGWFYRPLWTYEAEKRAARIIFYFYSTNCEHFKQSDTYPPISYGWQAMNWPFYLVWDEYQADFVRRAVGTEANIRIVGPIWFQASSVELPPLHAKSIAIFDVTPYRASRYRILGLDFEYYFPETSIAFLDDIQKACKLHGYQMLWKKKRKVGKIAHPQYRFFTDTLSEYGHVTILDPDISAHRVIEASSAVISMPCTSTALIARDLLKPSCYYDPNGHIQKDDRAAHNIEIVQGPEALSAWLVTVNTNRALKESTRVADCAC